jgi:hypothetical protein
MTVYRDQFKAGPFNLGSFSPVINLIAIAWVSFAIVLFALPQVRLSRVRTPPLLPHHSCSLDPSIPRASTNCIATHTHARTRDPTQVYPVNMQNLNYASICVAITLVVATAWWVLDAKSWFKGPKFGYDGDGDASVEAGEGKGGKVKDVDVMAK